MWIIERWGARDAFLRSKATALPELHAEMRRWIGSDSTPAVIETTGLSDAPLLDDLEAAGGTFVVRLDVSEQDARRRVAERDRGRHLSDEPEHNRSVRRAFDSGAASRGADLVIDTSAVTVASAAARIADALKT